MQAFKSGLRWAGLRLMILAFVALTLGCAKQIVYTSAPAADMVQKTDYEIRFRPLNDGQNVYTGFGLEITNHGSQALTIDWNRSRYLHDGQNNGRFIFAGIDPASIKAGTIDPDIIPAGNRLSKDIVPFRFLAMAPVRSKTVRGNQSAFRGGVLPAGKNTIRLVFKLGEQKLTETLSVTLRATERSLGPGD